MSGRCASPKTSLPAQSAFERALKLVRSDHPNAIPDGWLDGIHTITEVEKEVQRAQKRYEDKSRSQVGTWLGSLSLSIMHYARILDVLVQHHPEYVSLAWGTTKLLFVLFQNREELLMELTKSFATLNGLLPRVQIQANVFDDPRMQNHVEVLYADIVRYYHAMLQFYEEGRAKRIWKLFIQPFTLRFGDIAERVRVQSQAIVELAAALSQERQQETEALIRQTQNTLMEVRKELASQRSLIFDHMSMTEDLRTASMIEAARSDIFEDPCDVLDLRISLCQRQQRQRNINIEHVWKSALLLSWSSTPESAILIVQGSLSKKLETLAVATFMTKLVHAERMPVLWALQNATEGQHVQTTPAQVLKYLAMQALQLNNEAIGGNISQNFNHTRISSANTTRQWTILLRSALLGVKLAYILVDVNLVCHEDSSTMIQVLLECLAELAVICKPTVLKIAVINSRRTASVNPQSIKAECLNLDKTLSKGSRAHDRRVRNRSTMLGRHSLAFRSRLRSQEHTRT